LVIDTSIAWGIFRKLLLMLLKRKPISVQAALCRRLLFPRLADQLQSFLVSDMNF
jgi:hypothetical protein